jgi:RNA polymerase sigma-70 factor (ECF subfamily)
MASAREGSDADQAPTTAEARERIERLYREQGPGLARRLRARLRSSEEAREVLQDGFARLLGSASLGALRQPEAYLNRILRNLLIDRGRRARARPLHSPIDFASEPAIRPEQSDNIEVEQMRERYRAALAALPPRTREVFLLHRVQELGYREIGEALGISPRTVEWHVAEAIARLARGLEQE